MIKKDNSQLKRRNNENVKYSIFTYDIMIKEYNYKVKYKEYQFLYFSRVK